MLPSAHAPLPPNTAARSVLPVAEPPPAGAGTKHLPEAGGLASVCAIVVTFNRRQLLLRALEAVLAQTAPVSAIVIVDNASTDGTAEALVAAGHFDALPTAPGAESVHRRRLTAPGPASASVELVYVRLASNDGGAGGFCRGQQVACADGWNWLWMLDDDGYPDRDCLQSLLDSARRHQLQALNPLVLDVDDGERLAFGMGKGLKTAAAARAAAGTTGLLIDKASPFNGFLMKRALCERIGYVKREMFIWGDEREYLLRLNRAGVRFATDVAATFRHPRSKTVKKSALLGLLKIVGKPEHLEMNYFRNQGYISRCKRRWWAHGPLVKGVLYYLLHGQAAKAATLLRYYVDGWADRYALPNIRPAGVTPPR